MTPRFKLPPVKLHHLLWLGLILLFAWGAPKLPFAAIWQAIHGLSLAAVMTLILLNVGLFLLFSGRWWLILRAQGYRVPYLALVGYRLAGFSMSYFTPGPQFGGEPLQVYLTRTYHNLPTHVAVASVALDKLLELLVNFTFLATGIAITVQSGLFGELGVQKALGLALALLALPAGYLFSLWAGWQPLKGLRRLPRLAASTAFRAAVEAENQAVLFCRQHPGVLLAALILSLVVWAGMILEYGLMLKFLGLPLTLTQTITALTAARLAFLAPTPGGLVALEASQAFAIQALGFSPALGISVALLIRARDLAIGALGLWWTGVLTRGLAAVPVRVQARDEAR